jgi:hypothetical protein
MSKYLYQSCNKTKGPKPMTRVDINDNNQSSNSEEKRRKGNLPGLLKARGVKKISHSQFAYDTLMLVSTTIRITKHFQKFLSSFLAASGGKLNISKCRIYGWHIPGHIKDQISRIFDFPIISTWNYFKLWECPSSLALMDLQPS